MQAVILAGGLGTRLRPLTPKTPKVMVKIRGVEFLWYVVSWFERNRIEDIVVCAGRVPEGMAAKFTSSPCSGARLTFSIEDHPLGTAGAVRNALDCLADGFILINGDTFLPIESAPILAHWEKTKRDFDCLMLAYDNRENIAPNDTAIDSDGVVVAYSKRSPAGMHYVNAGLVVIKKKVFEKLPPGVPLSLEGDVYPKLVRRRKMTALVTSERYYDIGTPERLRTFEEYADRHPEVVPRKA
jgi:NDP-sugar pyrophosphorylase family protein